MIPYEGQEKESVNWAFAQTLKTKENPARPGTIAASQFEKPLLNFQEHAQAVVKHHILNY